MRGVRAFIVMGAAFAVLLLASCAHDPTEPIGAPVLDSQFGQAVKRAKAMQVIHPEGVKADDQGYSGKAAHNAMERYDMSGSNSTRAGTPAPEGNTKAAK